MASRKPTAAAADSDVSDKDYTSAVDSGAPGRSWTSSVSSASRSRSSSGWLALLLAFLSLFIWYEPPKRRLNASVPADSNRSPTPEDSACTYPSVHLDKRAHAEAPCVRCIAPHLWWLEDSVARRPSFGGACGCASDYNGVEVAQKHPELYADAHGAGGVSGSCRIKRG
ncbi:hypothetical protein B0H10DRAFT_1945619 [Mycena sp. CBHHK59/15]|nr:hypothetical protein B0H10DRAFT_1945619 [Mycena sp. CBHHK59/15]